VVSEPERGFRQQCRLRAPHPATSLSIHACSLKFPFGDPTTRVGRPTDPHALISQWNTHCLLSVPRVPYEKLPLNVVTRMLRMKSDGTFGASTSGTSKMILVSGNVSHLRGTFCSHVIKQWGPSYSPAHAGPRAALVSSMQRGTGVRYKLLSPLSSVVGWGVQRSTSSGTCSRYGSSRSVMWVTRPTVRRQHVLSAGCHQRSRAVRCPIHMTVAHLSYVRMMSNASSSRTSRLAQGTGPS
jgi:hypothetical protein